MAGQGSVKKALVASAESFDGKLDREHYERGDGKNAEDVVIECALKSDLVDLVLTDRRVEFSEDMRTSFPPNPELDAMFYLDMPMKVNLTARRLIIKEYLTTVAGARACAADNSLDDTLFRDAILAVVPVYVRATEVIAPNSTRPIKEPSENTESLIDDTLMRNWRVLSTRVTITALFVFCQGPVNTTLRWYESYADVYGAFITEARLLDVCNLIFNMRSPVILCQKISLGDIEGLNNVLKYCAERLSYPTFVLSALRVIEGIPLMAFVNPFAVSEYKKFYEGGMEAQMASNTSQQSSFLSSNFYSMILEEIDDGYISQKAKELMSLSFWGL